MNYYIIRSKSDSKSIRVVQAKNRNAAIAHVYGDLWAEPVKADSTAWAEAMAAGAKLETAK